MHLQAHVADRIATLTIHRPEVRNAIDHQTVGEMTSALDSMASRDDVGVVILTGTGDRAFVAGADLRQMRHWRREEALARASSRLMRDLERFPKPTIAAVNGSAMGGGCELALACDLRIAADHVTFGQPEVALGVIPAAGGTQRLPRLIGLARAKQMILTGDPIDAQTALVWGLVTAIVPGGELVGAARALAARILRRGPLALRLAKLALNASSSADLDTGLLIESLAQALCFESDDKQEGVSAFLEKRSPRFVR